MSTGFSFKARQLEAEERHPPGVAEGTSKGRNVLMGIWGSSDKQKAESEDDALRRVRLAELTATAKRGLSAFADTGTALAAIQAEELWRLVSPTWEGWCSSELGLTERRVGQLIEAARTCSALRESGKLPRTERVARELAGLPADKQLEAWTEAVAEAGNEEPTAEQVAKAAKKRKPRKARRAAVAKPANYRVPGAAVRVTPRKSGFTTHVAALEYALELARKAEQDSAGLKVA